MSKSIKIRISKLNKFLIDTFFSDCINIPSAIAVDESVLLLWKDGKSDMKIVSIYTKESYEAYRSVAGSPKPSKSSRFK